MRLVFSVFFDIENYEDFFYRIIQSRLKCVESEKYLINVETLEQICNTQIEPSYSTHPWEGYVFLQKDSFVIFRNNDSDGYFSFVHNIAMLYNIRTAHIRIYDEKPYPGYFLTYYENQKQRVIYNIKENRWKFYHTGDPAFFEEGDNYEEKRIPDKFNKEKLLLFCNRMGINLEDEDFFKPVAPIFHFYETVV